MYYAEILIYKLIITIEDMFKKKNKKDEHEIYWGIGGK